MACSGCQRRREAIVRLVGRIVPAVRPAKSGENRQKPKPTHRIVSKMPRQQ
jgi:hypothetical protein